jgi:hypothetical protein
VRSRREERAQDERREVGFDPREAPAVTSDSRIEASERVRPDRRLEFETFLADLSARFVALPSERVDEEIRNALILQRTFQ